MADTLNCVLKFNDTLRTVTLKRPQRKISLENLKSREQRTAEKPVREMAHEKAEEQGYDPQTKTWSKNLTFTSPDSSIAILTVRDFSNGVYTDYYRKCFRMLDSLKTKTLILDVRDNPGGNAPDAACLFSYLADTVFIFDDKSEVVSKKSITQYRYFRGNPLLINAILAIGYPMQLFEKGVLLMLTQQGPDQKYYTSFPESDSARPKKKRFRGDLYVVINGGTFSAAANLASNLKGINRGTFVGEETGGAANGTVAGKMAMIKLPESRLFFTFGLAHTQPHYRSGPPGRGVMPDVEIRPTVQDRINGVDPETQYVVRRVGGTTDER
jgi:C-terminal processing protease CtpA/Prc